MGLVKGRIFLLHPSVQVVERHSHALRVWSFSEVPLETFNGHIRTQWGRLPL